MAGESGRVVEVMRQDGNQILISVPMTGVPPGFKLRPGERAVLVSDENGLSVRPLIRALEVNAAEVEGDSLKAEEQRFAVQESTVRSEGRRADTRADQRVVFVVERGSAAGPEQVIAIRRDRPAR
jgi:predicted phosphoribosyltransferase